MPRWSRRRVTMWLCVALLIAFVGANWLARRHALAFLRFTDARSRTPSPEHLSWIDKIGLLLSGVSIPKPTNERTPASVGLTFEEHRVQSTGDATLAIWHVPRAHAVGSAVLLHGFAAAKDSMLDAAVLLHDAGWTCYLVDFRGSGDSTAAYTTLGVREADDVIAVVRWIQASHPLGRLILVGSSMGAVAALRAVADGNVTVDGLVLEAPFDRMTTTVRNRFRLLGLPAFPGAELLVFWGGREFGFDGFAHNPVEYARAVDIPTLILHGSRDERVGLAEVEAVFAALAGRKALEVFDGVAHLEFATLQPQRWQATVAAFFAAAPP